MGRHADREFVRGVAAHRLLGLTSCSVVFTTYHTSSNFDYTFAKLQECVIAERGEDLFLFRWLFLIWALIDFDIFHLYNDRGLIEPAGGYGSPSFGIAIQEMDIYRRAGKRLYTYAYGADHRTREKTLAWEIGPSVPNARRLERFASVMMSAAPPC